MVAHSERNCDFDSFKIPPAFLTVVKLGVRYHYRRVRFGYYFKCSVRPQG